MKIIANRNELIKAVAICARATAGRTPKPILQCVKMAPKDKILVLEATDLETYIRTEVTQVQIDKPEPTAVNASELLKALRSFSEETISLETVGEKLAIKGNRSKISYYTADPAGMPPLMESTDGVKFDIAAADLASAYATLAKIPNNAASASQKGLLFNVANGMMAIVGTDGRRMGERTFPVPKKLKAAGIVPTHPLSVIIAAAADATEPVSITITGNAALLSLPGLTVATSLIEGQFPPYEAVVPKDGDKIATFKREDLLNALRQAMLTTVKESKGARFNFTAGGLSVTTTAPGLGESDVQCECDYEGEDLEVGFNPAYWADVLASIAEEKVRIEMHAANRPALLTVPGFRYVLMPINLK